MNSQEQAIHNAVAVALYPDFADTPFLALTDAPLLEVGLEDAVLVFIKPPFVYQEGHRRRRIVEFTGVTLELMKRCIVHEVASQLATDVRVVFVRTLTPSLTRDALRSVARLSGSAAVFDAIEVHNGFGRMK